MPVIASYWTPQQNIRQQYQIGGKEVYDINKKTHVYRSFSEDMTALVHHINHKVHTRTSVMYSDMTALVPEDESRHAGRTGSAGKFTPGFSAAIAGWSHDVISSPW